MKIISYIFNSDSQDLKPRKSVAFSEEALISDKNESFKHADDETNEESQTTTQPDLSNTTSPDTSIGINGSDDKILASSNDNVSNMLKGMKKKKKIPKIAEEENVVSVEDGGLDLSNMKKKKKKKSKETPEDEFAAKIAALRIDGKDGESTAVGLSATSEIYEGDMELGTGLWQHNSDVKIPYDKLLSRFFILLAQKNPDHLSSGSKSYKIPPPQCLREGNKKTIFANIAEICKRMKRTDEHVTSYLFAELGTSGSVDGNRRLVIKGRFQQKQIENVLRRYISMYIVYVIYLL